MTRCTRSEGWLRPCVLTLSALFPASVAHAQVSLSTAVNLALRNSPKVKAAEADVLKARAVLAQSRDAFVPAVAANGGVGKSTGAPLGPPVVFSITAQSLVFNFSQRDYIRGAHSGLDAARMSLDAARGEAVEDAANTYVALDNALERRTVETEALGFAHRLAQVAQERFEAGVDPHIELTRARHTEAEIRLNQLLVDDEIAEQSGHLARLAGLSSIGLTTDHVSIPAMALHPASDRARAQETTSLVATSAGFAAAQARRYTALAEQHYLLRPQVAFSANYSRIATAFTSYTEYYPGFDESNSFNSLNLGVEITVPILDMVHRNKAREAVADAARALADAQTQQMVFLDGREKLRRSTVELAARRDLAALDRELAQDQLDAVLVRLQASAGALQGSQTTPKDEQSARLQERMRTLDMLGTDLQLQQAEISLMRQEGTLAGWILGGAPSRGGAAVQGSAPSATQAQPRNSLPLPATVGTPAGGAAAPQSGLPASNPNSTPAASPATAVPVPPTTGTPPAGLPSGPVTAPAPSSAPPSSPGGSTVPSGAPRP